MSYSAEHKQKTRMRIVEAARVLFNRHGFEGVTIDAIMKAAGLTRGGFYNHFESKEQLYGESVSSFLMGRGARWRADAGVDPSRPSPVMARRMIDGYLSVEHLDDLDGQCPMIALPSDVARAKPEVQSAYEGLLRAMVSIFEGSLGGGGSAGARACERLGAGPAVLAIWGARYAVASAASVASASVARLERSNRGSPSSWRARRASSVNELLDPVELGLFRARRASSFQRASKSWPCELIARRSPARSHGRASVDGLGRREP